MTTLDSFDDLCRAVFVPSSTATSDTVAWAFSTPADQTNAPSSETEYTLSLLLQAQPYELTRSASCSSSPLPLSPSPSLSSSPAGGSTAEPGGGGGASKTIEAPMTVMYRRLPLESVEGPVMEQRVLSILRQAGVALLEQPYDRNMGGHATSKSRSEILQQSSTLERPVVLEMDQSGETSMWLIPEDQWIQYTARVRFWRAESHRIKAVERHATLVRAIHDRWTVHSKVLAPFPSPVVLDDGDDTSSRTLSTLSSGTFSNLSSAPGSPLAAKDAPMNAPTPTAAMQSPSPLPETAYHCYLTSKASSTTGQQPPTSQQQDQATALLTFVHQYGDELSVRSTIRGLLDFIRKQIGDRQLLVWTFDSATLTEQKLEITEAFLDLLACLGLERMDNMTATTTAALSPISSPATTITTNINNNNSPRGSPTVVSSNGASPTPSAPNNDSMDELAWTLGLDADDQRLEFWIEAMHQNKDPVRSLSKALRDRYLHDRHTIAAGSVSPLMFQTAVSALSSQQQQQQHSHQPMAAQPRAICRQESLVMTRSRWSKSAALTNGHGGRGGGGAVSRARKDLADLARWATGCCSGRLDWLWRWFYGWLRPSSRRSGGGGSGSRSTRSSRRNSRRLSSPPLSNDGSHGKEGALTVDPLATQQYPDAVWKANEEDDDMDAESTVVVEHWVRSNDENV